MQWDLLTSVSVMTVLALLLSVPLRLASSADGSVLTLSAPRRFVLLVFHVGLSQLVLQSSRNKAVPETELSQGVLLFSILLC